jgi:hypothetical protein
METKISRYTLSGEDWNFCFGDLLEDLEAQITERIFEVLKKEALERLQHVFLNFKDDKIVLETSVTFSDYDEIVLQCSLDHLIDLFFELNFYSNNSMTTEEQGNTILLKNKLSELAQRLADKLETTPVKERK